MSVQVFSEELAKLLELEPDELKPDIALDSLGTWDSLTFVSTIALYETNYNLVIDHKTLCKCKYFSDLLDLIPQSSLDKSLDHAI